MQRDRKPSRTNKHSTNRKPEESASGGPEHPDPDPKRDEQRANRPTSKLEWAGFFLLVGTLIASGFAAYWTSQQWAIMDDQEKRQLRAYVGVITGDVENFGDKEKQVYHFMRHNYGATPAYDLTLVEFGQAIIKRGGAVPKSGQIPPADISGTITLFPTAELAFHWKGIYPPIHGQIPALLESDDMQFVYYGTLEYHDVFKRPQFTYFCWMYGRKQTIAKDAEGCLFRNDST